MQKNDYDIKDLELSGIGKLKIEWAGQQMPVLKKIHERFEKTKPLKGLTIAACLHVTSETANLMLCLKAGGAKVILCASNPLSTQDMVLLLWLGIIIFQLLPFMAKTPKFITSI